MKKILVRTHTYKSIAQTWSKVKPRLAFTLAEVLVVIGIIGMIADLTLPNLIQNYQKQVYVTQLKKAYTVFNQALIQMSADMGCPGDLKCTGLFDDFNALVRTQKFGEEITKHMKVIKTVNAGEVQPVMMGDYGNSIWASALAGIHYDMTNNNNSYPIILSTSDYKFMTIDGMLYRISSNQKCSSTQANLKNICGRVLIDVNGFKPPNYFGRDIFHFYIINNGPALYPRGGQKTGADWWKHAGTGQPRACYPGFTEGTFCAGRIMEEGWKMNY